MPLNSTMIAVAVPSIARTVDHDPADVTQALVATYLIAAIALQGPGGKLGDRLGHWRVCAFGQAVIGVGAVVGFLAPNLPVLAGSRILMATGGALAVPATVALLRIELPPERRGRAFGMFGAIMASAAALGPIIGGSPGRRVRLGGGLRREPAGPAGLGAPGRGSATAAATRARRPRSTGRVPCCSPGR